MTTETLFAGPLLAEEEARRRLRRRLRRGPAGETAGALVLRPMWIAATKVIADRPPFRPRVQPQTIFIDAVSGYRGLLEKPPPARRVTLDPRDPSLDGIPCTLLPRRLSRSRAEELVGDVQRRQIDRSYALRKPRHALLGLELMLLPLWRFEPGGDAPAGTVNALSGDDESFLMDQPELSPQE